MNNASENCSFETIRGSLKVVTTWQGQTFYSVLFVNHGETCTTRRATHTTRKGAQRWADKQIEAHLTRNQPAPAAAVVAAEPEQPRAIVKATEKTATIQSRQQVGQLLDLMMWANKSDGAGRDCPYASGDARDSQGVYGHCYRAIVAIVEYETGWNIENAGGRYGWNLGGNANYLADIDALLAGLMDQAAAAAESEAENAKLAKLDAAETAVCELYELTRQEQYVLEDFLTDDYCGSTAAEWLDNGNLSRPSTWAFSIGKGSKFRAGVIGSLNKKGFVTSQAGSGGDDDTVTLEATGRRFLIALRDARAAVTGEPAAS